MDKERELEIARISAERMLKTFEDMVENEVKSEEEFSVLAKYAASSLVGSSFTAALQSRGREAAVAWMKEMLAEVRRVVKAFCIEHLEEDVKLSFTVEETGDPS